MCGISFLRACGKWGNRHAKSGGLRRNRLRRGTGRPARAEFVAGNPNGAARSAAADDAPPDHPIQPGGLVQQDRLADRQFHLLLGCSRASARNRSPWLLMFSVFPGLGPAVRDPRSGTRVPALPGISGCAGGRPSVARSCRHLLTGAAAEPAVSRFRRRMLFRRLPFETSSNHLRRRLPPDTNQ